MWNKSKVLKGATALAVSAVVVVIGLGGYYFSKDGKESGEGGNESGQKWHIAVDVPPYYTQSGHRAAVGAYSEGLSAADRNVVLQTVGDMEKDWENLPVTAMYVAALRLFEIEERDRALYWYEGAKYRAALFMKLLDGTSEMNRMGSKAFMLSRAHTAFFVALRPYIGEYGLCDIDNYRQTAERAGVGREDVPKLNTIYPGVVFLPQEKWPAAVKKVNEDFERQIARTAETYETIAQQSKAAATRGRYCKD
jgi:hypothetical protein